jgi:hypothetical protein
MFAVAFSFFVFLELLPGGVVVVAPGMEIPRERVSVGSNKFRSSAPMTQCISLSWGVRAEEGRFGEPHSVVHTSGSGSLKKLLSGEGD